MSVLLTDGSTRSTLAATRSLGRRGATVIVGDDRGDALSFASRYCHRRLVYPTPGGAGFRQWLPRTAQHLRPSVLIPMSDETAAVMVELRGELGQWTSVAVPPPEVFALAQNKARTLEIARQAGVPTPLTCTAQDMASVRRFAESVGLPLVVKPQSSSGSRGLSIVRAAADLEAAVRDAQRDHGPTLVQEYVPGSVKYQVGALFNNASQLRAMCTHRFFREYPIDGGPATFMVTERYPALEAGAISLLEHMGWQGVAVAEFKIDARDGQPRLMEVNPRLWGTIGASMAAGVDFPALMVAMALNGDVPPHLHFRAGVYWRWLIPGDILNLLAGGPRLRRSSPRGIPGTAIRDAIVSADDPGPTAGLLASYAMRCLDPQLWRRTILRLHASRRAASALGGR